MAVDVRQQLPETGGSDARVALVGMGKVVDRDDGQSDQHRKQHRSHRLEHVMLGEEEKAQ